MSASDLRAPLLQNADRCPQSQADQPQHRPASQRRAGQAGLALLAAPLTVRGRPELRQEGELTVPSVNGVPLRNAKPAVFGNSGQQPGKEPAKFQLGWEGMVTLRRN